MINPSPAKPLLRANGPRSGAERPATAAARRALQPRSRATRDSLLQVARDMLQQRDLESLSIAELAAGSGVSVGSFYGRFHDKASFFQLLQQQVAAEWLGEARDGFAAMRASGWAPRQVLDGVCHMVIDIFRRDAGFFRASSKHAAAHPEIPSPLKKTGALIVVDLVDLLAPLLTQLPPDQRAPRIRFAMQMLYGTGVNAVINDPGPLKLADPALARELANALAAYLQLPPDTGLPAGQGQGGAPDIACNNPSR